MGYPRKTSFCRKIPSVWARVVKGMKRIAMVIMMADILDMINTSFCFFGTDFTDFTVFIR